mmetsp:Transcript_15741/g.17773  ORF Transcript_15741/g.17773 Transcript_15741/m.17773 type:complete len:368 (+) Transcript_15741:53-1156(+)
MTSNNTCTFSFLSPGGNHCSENGVCTEFNKCLCKAGWTGIGDFAVSSLDCDLNLKSIRILWSIALVAHVPTLLLCLYYLYYMLLVLPSSKKETLLFVCGVLVCSICYLTVAFSKITSSEKIPAIGLETGITVVFSIGAGFVWFVAIYFINKFADIYVKKAEKLGGRKLSYSTNALPVAAIVNVAFSLSPILCLVDKENCSVYGTMHYALSIPLIVAVGLVWNVQFIKPFIYDIEQILASPAAMLRRKEEEIAYNVLLVKLKKTFKLLFQISMNNVLISGCMLWPYLLRKASYQLPFAAFFNGLALFTGVHLLCNGEQRAIDSLSRKTDTSSSMLASRNTLKKSNESVRFQKGTETNNGDHENYSAEF